MARKDESTTDKPAKKPGRFSQVTQVYSAARQVDKSVTWWMVGTALLVEAVFVVVGLVTGHPIYFGLIGIPLAAMAGMIVMARRAERAAYRQLEGQPGAGGAALGALRKGWYYDQQPVAAEAMRPGDMSSAALVYRAVGRPGIVLVTEGPVARAAKLAEGERKRVARVAPNVPVHVVRLGSAEDEVPVRKLAGKLTRMKPALSKTEVDAVQKRLKALGGARMPVPKGVDPMRARVDRRAMRGR